MRIRSILVICFTIFIGFLYGQRSEDYKTIAEDGAWCWFSDPRSVYHKGEKEQTFTAYVSSEGDIMVNAMDHKTGIIQEKMIYPHFQRDDHDVPSILILPDGKLKLFFTKHNGKIYSTQSKKAEDISSFEKIDSLDLGRMLCYTNPVMLSEENNRIYLFSRGGYDWKPSYITSDDLGKTWSKPTVILSKKINDKYNRPYTKVVSDGKSTIHFAVTDGHPREENHNSIYYLKYKGGSFYDAADQVIGDLKNLPIDQATIPKAYDGVSNNQRSWIWDIALDSDDHPVIVYTVLPEETKHLYYYGRWDGKQWNNKMITPGGSAFPRFDRKKETRDPEPHYSGGIVLDHTNPDNVYLSCPIDDRFEIQKWTTNDKGNSFEKTDITSTSLHDNVRPFVVRNAPENVDARVLWMQIDDYEHYTKYHTSIKGNAPGHKFRSDFSKHSIREVLEAVADWQIDNFGNVKHHPLDWTNGALYTGLFAWSQVADSSKYEDWLVKNVGRKFNWEPFYRMYHADDVVVSQMYLDMYQKKKDEKQSYRILNPTKARIDFVINNPSSGSLILDYRDAQTLERWSWCDALFMAPPVYVKMYNISGDDKYLSFMDKEFKATYDFLYDKEEHMFYRDHRYFPEEKKEANGKKIFWGRGNGWVMGGLVSILKDLPKDSSYRPYYEQLFKEMSSAIVECQDDKGFWHASMLDPDSYPTPETSSTGFFCYALAYGLNSGLLDAKKYEPHMKLAWQALVDAVYPDGKLGWVQPIGADPRKVTQDMTEVYGVGAFLLAGTEILSEVEK